MFIIEEIRVLIQAAKDCEERLPKEEQYIHVSDIAATLQKLIDDEDARIDAMADEHEEREAGAAAMDWAAQEKMMDDETRSFQDWPGGV